MRLIRSHWPSDGIEAKEAVVAQLARALEVIRRYSPQRILTLGGECSVSVAPFSWLTERYGDDLAVLWIDSHPDAGTPASQYPGYHAMAVAVLYLGSGHLAFNERRSRMVHSIPVEGATERSLDRLFFF